MLPCSERVPPLPGHPHLDELLAVLHKQVARVLDEHAAQLHQLQLHLLAGAAFLGVLQDTQHRGVTDCIWHPRSQQG